MCHPSVESWIRQWICWSVSKPERVKCDTKFRTNFPKKFRDGWAKWLSDFVKFYLRLNRVAIAQAGQGLF